MAQRKRTRYVTVTLTETEADALLTMAYSGDYHDDEGDHPEITIPSRRAERKILRALIALRQAAAPDTE